MVFGINLFRSKENRERKINEFIIGHIRYEVLISYTDGKVAQSIQKYSTELKLWMNIWLKFCKVCVCLYLLTLDGHVSISQVNYSQYTKAVVIDDF